MSVQVKYAVIKPANLGKPVTERAKTSVAKRIYSLVHC